MDIVVNEELKAYIDPLTEEEEEALDRSILAEGCRISINAAAAVATLPGEEQIAVANAGKDELKQAAKRARESRRKPREEPAAMSQAATESDESQKLRRRVAELTAENEALRRQLAALATA